MLTRSTSLLTLSLAVGAFAALTGRAFTWLMLPRVGIDFGLPPFAYAWISPIVLFVSASCTFALAFGVLPATRGLARQAGCLAGIATYVCHAVWIAVYAGMTRDSPAFMVFMHQLVIFVVIGWLPIVSGIFAGWCVERWLRVPRVKPEVRRGGTLASACFDFALAGALLSVPLILVVSALAKRSRVAFAFFFPSAPFVVFALAAAAFWMIYPMLPAMRWRGRIAGALAALGTFFCFLLWTRYAINISTRNGLPYGSPNEPFFAAFLLTGWVPVVFGALVGGWAARRLDPFDREL